MQPPFPSDHQVSLASVLAFLSALTTALSIVGRVAHRPEPLDPFLLVEVEMLAFHEHFPDLRNLSDQQRRDLDLILEIFRGMKPTSDLIRMDPADASEH